MNGHLTPISNPVHVTHRVEDVGAKPNPVLPVISQRRLSLPQCETVDIPNYDRLKGPNGINPSERRDYLHPNHPNDVEEGRAADNGTKYNSSLGELGVEYMRATGAIGKRFKFLQRPNFGSIEGSFDPSQTIDNDQCNNDNQRVGSIALGLRNDLAIVVPMATPMAQVISHPVGGNDGKEKPVSIPANVAETCSNHRRKLFHNSHQHHFAGYRLNQRKTLQEKRRKLANYCCALALTGLLFMVLEMECIINGAYGKEDVPSYVFKGIISLTTLLLLGFIAAYHVIDVKLFVVDNCIEDWRIAMSWPRVVQIITEITVCAIHPVPVSLYFDWVIYNLDTAAYQKERVPVDTALSIPMLARLYLIIRALLLHSKLFTNASSRTIGALNKVTFNARFVLKTIMNIYPGRALGLLMVSLWIIFSWVLRACESNHESQLANFLNCMYLTAITCLAVGYGDFAPQTYCGRTVSILSGLMGAGCTALVVAVIAKKLELTRAEKHVHNFMIDNQLSKKLKDAAANVLRETWLIYKYTKLVKRVNIRKVRNHQRKFLSAINSLRRVKLKQRKLADQSNSLVDFAKTTTNILDAVRDMSAERSQNDEKVERLEAAIITLKAQVEMLPQTITKALLDSQLSIGPSRSGGQQPVLHSLAPVAESEPDRISLAKNK